LNNTERTIDFKNLYITNLWENCTQTDLDDIFKPFGRILQSRICKNGVGFVRYERPESAKQAMEAFNVNQPYGRCYHGLIVRYAYNHRSIKKANKGNVLTISNKNNIILRGLPEDFSRKKLRSLCEKYGEITSLRLYQGKGFVRFEHCGSADKALQELNGYELENCVLFAKLANYDTKNKPKKSKHLNVPVVNQPKKRSDNNIPNNYHNHNININNNNNNNNWMTYNIGNNNIISHRPNYDNMIFMQYNGSFYNQNIEPQQLLTFINQVLEQQKKFSQTLPHPSHLLMFGIKYNININHPSNPL